MNDLELLQRYQRDGAQAAFQTVVSRYISLVYSAAKRQVHSPDLAKEVAQTVFLDLASSASKLRSDTLLPSWLHTATRRRSIDVVRRETARLRLERAAAEEQKMTSATPSWSQLEPLLDEALSALPEADRRALLLRFFENKSLYDVGVVLACSEDSAQKRVARALDRLRGYFSERGLITVAAVLASELSTRAVGSAPVGLAASVSLSVFSEIAASAAQHAARVALFSGLKVAALTVALAGSAILLCYESYVSQQQHHEIASLSESNQRWQDTLRAFRARAAEQRNAAANSANLPDPFISADPEFDKRMRAAFGHAAELRRRFAADPRQQIPEMKLLNFKDWFHEASSNVHWDSDESWRKAMAGIRIVALNRSGSLIAQALESYVSAHQGQLPKSINELEAFSHPKLGADILDRYDLIATGPVGALSEQATVVAERNNTAVDPDNDNLAVVGWHWFGVTSANQDNSLNAKLDKIAQPAIAAYRAAHGGKSPNPRDPESLRPYFSDPQKGEAFVEIMHAIISAIPHFKEDNAAGSATNAYVAAHHGQQPNTPQDLIPYFKFPEDAGEYLKFASHENTR